MNDANAVLIFLKVAELGGFVAAARSLDLPKSTVSLKVNALEQRLGVRLFHRTTRRVALTEEGRLYYENCLPILDALQEADDAIASLQEHPQGVLRVTATILFVQTVLAPNLPEFLLTYPDIRVILHATTAYEDIVKEGYDLAIRIVRIGQLDDSTLGVRQISTGRLKLFASATYLKTADKLKAIADLHSHPLLHMAHGQNETTWTLHNEHQETETLSIRPRLLSNDIAPIYQAIVAGIGIGLLPEFLFQQELQSGNIVNVLPQCSSAPIPINALYPSRKYIPMKVRVFLEFLEQKMR
ncbi:LysR family transcriptional regulator [Chroococcidiopsis sp. FACHB-1243]|uniref:LysR family transcriptional regulator n=1 Tax=Chroococcidiopsis sp. [FACHB-1243] TaxID=2692781 RepID=UPI0019C48331|nr:LysR family transcriptional regulator [Chroococcidiopsis sp. [FACHB-1243]]MBD2310006.1 LysR family transcriptional regulator [Chroococcidiopsis sp. [FACHB-1243]]